MTVDTDSTGAMAAAWFGATGAEKAIEAVFPDRQSAMPPDAGPLTCFRAGEQVCTMQQALEYAAKKVAVERERLAQWYATSGWLLDEDDVSDAMRKA